MECGFVTKFSVKAGFEHICAELILKQYYHWTPYFPTLRPHPDQLAALILLWPPTLAESSTEAEMESMLPHLDYHVVCLDRWWDRT